MRVKFTTAMRNWLRKEDGGALAELAILVPFLAVMLAGVCEFGRYFQNYTTLAKATRTASRYLSNHQLNATEIARAQNLMVCGKLTCAVGDRNVLSGFTASNVCIETTTESPSSPVIRTVTVKVPRTGGDCNAAAGTVAGVPYTYTPIFNIGALLNNSTISLALPIAPSTTMYYMAN
jgi:Flp pilus assembly protein TadG